MLSLANSSMESFQAKVACAVNQHEGCSNVARDQRSVEDRFNKLLISFKQKLEKKKGESGTNPGSLSTEAKPVLKVLRKPIVFHGLLCYCQNYGSSRKVGFETKPH